MASLSAAKPCVKKKAGWPGKPVPDPVAGIRDVELFSPPSRAPAQPRLERVRWEGAAGIPICSSRVLCSGEPGTNGCGGAGPLPHPHMVQTRHRDRGQELFAACVMPAGGNK